MKVAAIRKAFFDYFQSKGHQLVPSAPLVVKNDPTLMFINAGMNQFKDYFLGNTVPEYKRVVNAQKCLRVSGKHNDLEEVGVDTYHHTMFEMLGNWSFGDYFKEEAAEWAWELLTEVFKIPKDRLYVTVFEGDEKDGVAKDQESIDIWKKYLDADRIILADKKDNFWEMGETGPCGPCSEIHIDLREDWERDQKDAIKLINKDHPQVVEIWNNVFMEFNRMANGSLQALPNKHVDTGMGLERLAMTLQGKTSNYDTDLFQALILKMESISGVKYRSDEKTDIALRVIADHIRAIAFSITDGQLPANTGAGYVIRRILRRAVRYGYQTLGLEEPFLCQLSPTLVDLMGDAYPELRKQKEFIFNVIQEEEKSFFRTLEQGLKRIQLLMDELNSQNKDTLPGSAVFELYDTYGFPFDLTSLIAKESNFKVDEKGFREKLQQQKNRSREATSIQTEDWVELLDDNEEEFIGYDKLTTQVRIVKYRKVSQKKKSYYQLVFNLTPFYPEGGGQVGDTGTIEHNGIETEIFDTKKENKLIIHLSESLPGDPSALFNAKVDELRRDAITANHSATHLLHQALRTVLGDHVEQKGSLVHPDYLRFDFSHFSKVSDEQLQEIEELVGKHIRENFQLEEKRNIPMTDAKEMGALALFGEKYNDTVRVIQFGNSIELCGGTHVASTGKIGLFKIISETAVASGVRRIEAITSIVAENYYKSLVDRLDAISSQLKNPQNILKAVTDLQTKNQQLQKELEQLQKEKTKQLKNQLKEKIKEENGISILSDSIEMDGSAIKDILFQLKGEFPSNFVGVLGGTTANKCTLSILISDNLVEEKELHAGKLIKKVAPIINGGGGGQAFFATAGGGNPNGLDEAIKMVLESVFNE